MALPTELLQAVAAAGGGRVALVLGAGCSMEAPTNLPAAWPCSMEIHRQLVADAVLVEGDCAEPGDLAILADSVFQKTGSQRAVVDRFIARYDLKLAQPNHGYLLAAAMLCEGAVGSVITFNFDLAMNHAMAELGMAPSVGVVESPMDLAARRARCVYYLHRNVNASDPETWVLRTSAMDVEWKGHWQPIIAASVLASPVVVFAGLGTPLSMLVETTKLIRSALPEGTKFIQVDPSPRDKSKTFVALRIDDASYVQQPWCAFMQELSTRLVAEQLAHLAAAAEKQTRSDGLTAENLSQTYERMKSFGLVSLGRARATWLLHDKRYCPDDDTARAQVADLLLAVQMMARVSDTQLVVADDSLIEFHKGGRIVAVFLLASGRGYRGRTAIEAEVTQRRMSFRGRAVQPCGVLVGGTSDAWSDPVSPPADVILGTPDRTDIMGRSPLPFFHLAGMRNDPNRVAEAVA